MNAKKDKIIITGGSGLVGQHLVKFLTDRSCQVGILSRAQQTGEPDVYYWDIEKGEIDPEALRDAAYIIHLAGAGIADKRWTASRKKVIVDSRVKSTRLLFDTVSEVNPNLKAFISASAVGYYGAATADHIFSEEDPPATDFLGRTCEQWEAAVDNFQRLGIRTVKLRLGMVLSSEGGAFEKMTKPIQWGAGRIGSGQQYMPWIHIGDLGRMFAAAITDTTMSGAYNAVAPEYLTNQQFTQAIAKRMNSPIQFPIPALALRLGLGEMANLLLEGSRVSNGKIEQTGFKYHFPKLKMALDDLMVG